MLGVGMWSDSAPTLLLDMHYSVVFDNYAGIELWVRAPKNDTHPELIVSFLSLVLTCG